MKNLIFTKATEKDIPELVRMRIAYMIDDFGSITDEEKEGMEKQLPDYFKRKLGDECVAFVAKDDDRIVSVALLIIEEKPANPFFLHGWTGEVLSVYTEPDYRHQGICTKIMLNLIDYAKDHDLDRVSLVATNDGYPIYKKVGFEDNVTKYKSMKYSLKI